MHTLLKSPILEFFLFCFRFCHVFFLCLLLFAFRAENKMDKWRGLEKDISESKKKSSSLRALKLQWLWNK